MKVQALLLLAVLMPNAASAGEQGPRTPPATSSHDTKGLSLGKGESGDGASCALQPGGESAVVAVPGPQILQLADGRFVRLIEVLVTPPGQPAAYDTSAAAVEYLRKISLGKRVEVKFGGMQRDRYGVYNGHVFVKEQTLVWLQAGLITHGYARAYPQTDNKACATRLIGLETKAREARAGHWGAAIFKVLQAGEPRNILNVVQTYQIVEGQVQNVTEKGGRIVLVFGGEGRKSFSVVLEPQVKRAFQDRRDAQSWKHTRLRVRGWVDRRQGPVISVLQAEQLEFLSAERSGEMPNKGSLHRKTGL